VTGGTWTPTELGAGACWLRLFSLRRKQINDYRRAGRP
jgi:hypothetical protein